jgi:hypothetical protein
MREVDLGCGLRRGNNGIRGRESFIQRERRYRFLFCGSSCRRFGRQCHRFRKVVRAVVSRNDLGRYIQQLESSGDVVGRRRSGGFSGERGGRVFSHQLGGRFCFAFRQWGTFTSTLRLSAFSFGASWRAWCRNCPRVLLDGLCGQQRQLLGAFSAFGSDPVLVIPRGPASASATARTAIFAGARGFVVVDYRSLNCYRLGR